MNALKPKHQRLVLVLLALVALVGAGLLAAYALRNQASYFYLPEQMLANPPQVGQAVRLGGMVEEGSLETAPDGVTLTFAVTGNGRRARAGALQRHRTRSLRRRFRRGRRGRLGADGTFVADNLLAKHDENYVPRELQDMEQHQAAKMAEETTVGLE